MRKKRRFMIPGLIGCLILVGVAAIFFWQNSRMTEQPDALLKRYTSYIEQQDYNKMYSMLNAHSKENITEEDFINRNQKIYEGIEAKDIKITITNVEEEKDHAMTVTYQTSFNSLAGGISFSNQAFYTKDREMGYALVWHDSLIFPELNSSDKVKVSMKEAKRGQIYDRNGRMLAGLGTATSVGLVPGKMTQNPGADITKLAKLLGISAESIQKKLDAKWVKEDSLVPITTIKKVSDLDLMKDPPSDETLKIKALQDKLLTIEGVTLYDVEMRTYPYGEKAAHLIGYVQNVTAEDLKEHLGEGYGPNSLIGRNGMEGLYEKELKGSDGCSITIVDKDGNIKSVLASILKEDGQDITLTIDARLQALLYEEFQNDKSCSVAMNPYTGEVLALVSTPSFDNNDFIRGISDEQWTTLNEDERKPLYNRFRQTMCPGSSFKPIIAAIGLSQGAIDPNEDYGNVGLSWQKDSSWGNYYVTTLHSYDSVILENALIYSDNIYFAKAALKIGADKLKKELDQLGFNEKLPFEITMSQSQYSNSDSIDTEVQLADSGYGQGQLLINPLHLAALYTAFANDGNVIKPYLLYKNQPEPQIWLPEAFTPEIADRVKKALEKVVNDSRGSGYGARRDDIKLAGKTGTAEIKAAKDDTSGTELGWFGIFTVEPDTENPILIMSVVEDVKDRGGSGYVLKKDKAVLDLYFRND